MNVNICSGFYNKLSSRAYNFSVLESLAASSLCCRLLSILILNFRSANKSWETISRQRLVYFFYQCKFTFTITMACNLYYQKISELNVNLIVSCFRYFLKVFHCKLFFPLKVKYFNLNFKKEKGRKKNSNTTKVNQNRTSEKYDFFFLGRTFSLF